MNRLFRKKTRNSSRIWKQKISTKLREKEATYLEKERFLLKKPRLIKNHCFSDKPFNQTLILDDARSFYQNNLVCTGGQSTLNLYFPSYFSHLPCTQEFHCLPFFFFFAFLLLLLLVTSRCSFQVSMDSGDLGWCLWCVTQFSRDLGFNF